ncbi:MAG: DUF2059 domain-containing protein [bacterium]
MKLPLQLLTILITLVCFAFSVNAQDQPSAKNIALAEELVSVMHLEQGVGFGLGKLKQIQEKTAASLGSSPESKAMLQKSMDSSMNAASLIMSWDKLKPIYVDAYASTFTTEELQGAIDFYKSPIGQKWVEKQPQASSIIMAKTMELGLAAQKPMMDSLKKSMDALDALRKGMNLTNLPSIPVPTPAASPTN